MDNQETDIQESGEDYLEVIYALKGQKSSVRSVDIVEERGFSKSSVSRAVNILKNRGFIIIADNGNIDFTETGLMRAREISQRHKILSDFLLRLGVCKETADADACKLEHDMSAETFDAIKTHAEKIK